MARKRASTGFGVGTGPTPAVEVEGGFEVVDVSEASGSLLLPLDRRVPGLQSGIGNPMAVIRQHVG